MSLPSEKCVCCGKTLPSKKMYCPHCGIKQSQWRENLDPFKLLCVDIKSQENVSVHLPNEQLVHKWNKNPFTKRISINDVVWAKEIILDLETRKRWEIIYKKKYKQKKDDMQLVYIFIALFVFTALLTLIIGLAFS